MQDFLSAQSLKVLPQGPFGDAVNQFVSKDDKHAMELFVSEHLTGQVKQLLGLESDDEDLNSAMDIYRTRIEQQMVSGPGRGMFNTERKRVLKPKPDTWDSDFDGNWEEEPGAWTYEGPSLDLSLTTTQEFGRSGRSKLEADDDQMSDDEPAPKTTKRSTARGSKAAAAKAAEKKAPARKAPAKGRGRKAVEQSEEEEEDVVMESDDEPPPPPKPAARGRKAAAPKGATTAAAKKSTTRGAAKSKQSKLDFSQKSGGGTQKAVEISDDEISDDDAFEPAPPISSRTRRR